MVKKVVISEGVTNIGDYAFKGCSSLTNIIIPSSVMSIGRYAIDGGTIIKNTGDGKWYLWVYAKDNLGNEVITKSEEFNFDNTAPTGVVSYSTTQPTNQNVIVTIKVNEKIQEVEGWTLSEDKLILTKTYTENGEEEVTIKDLAGNTSTIKVKVSNIDKTPSIKIKKGDINQDEKIDTTDLLKMLRHIAASKSEETANKHPEWVIE